MINNITNIGSGIIALLPSVKVCWYPIKPTSKLKQTNEKKSRLHQWWVDFTHRGVTQLREKAEVICSLLQRLYRYSKERAEEAIVKFFNKISKMLRPI